MATVCWDGREGSIIITWSQNELNRISLLAVLYVYVEIQDVPQIMVEDFFSEKENDPLCKSAQVKVEEHRGFFDINRNSILIQKAQLHKYLYSCVPEIIQSKLF